MCQYMYIEMKLFYDGSSFAIHELTVKSVKLDSSKISHPELYGSIISHSLVPLSVTLS